MECRFVKNIRFSHRTHTSLMTDERLMNCLPATKASRMSSSRSQCYHKLPDHAVRLMQEWYNANLDNPYPRTSDKKRFITEGNITAQQCRSWFANRRQRTKNVKRSQSRSSSSQVVRFMNSVQPRIPEALPVEEEIKPYDYCCYCQQHHQPVEMFSSMPPIALPIAPTTTINVVINEQTIEQLIHESLRKLLYPALVP